MEKKLNIEDYIGKTFNKRTVIKDLTEEYGRSYVLVRCECGKEDVVRLTNLLKGIGTACGKCRKYIKKPNNTTRYNIADYIGKKYGKRTIIKDAGKIKSKRMVLCRCDCGKEDLVPFFDLIGGRCQMCPKCNRRYYNPRALNMEEYIGKRYGNRVIIADVGIDKNGHHMVKCRCDCGNESIIDIQGLKNNSRVKCYQCSLKTRQTYKTHGKSSNKLYKVWQGMRERCYYKKHKGYEFYGARGIQVCDEWNNSFESFYEWAIANGYKKGLTIDRINVDGNYEPDNCRWATPAEQSINRRMQNNNTSGYIGIIRNSRDSKKWESSIGVNKKSVYLGIYNTKKDALDARNKYIIDNGLDKLGYKIQEYKGE